MSAEDVDELFASIESTPIATVITDPRLADNPVVAVNAPFCALTGYERDEILGRNCRFLAGPGTEPEWQAVLRRAIAEGKPALIELTNYRKDGTPFRNAVMIAPVLDEAGAVALYIGSQMDVGGQARPEPPARARAAKQVAALTVRQRQVLDHMIRGYRNKQIAGFLGIDEKTVKMHRAGLLTRLGAASSADAIRIGVEAGLTDPG
jgi:PAS domain S-box-containing protein